MNPLLFLNSEATTSESSSTADKMGETFKNMVKSPIFYAVIGGLVLLIIVVYLLRRIIKSRPNAVSVVVRGGQIHKLIDEKSNNYFMAPFVDRLGAVISLNEKELLQQANLQAENHLCLTGRHSQYAERGSPQ